MAEQAEAQCILMVDGDVLVRHAIADYLRDCGYVVIEASSTDEARTVVGEKSVGIDVILCDAEAPGSLNAFEFRNLAAGLRQNVRIALAGNIESAARKAADLCERGPHLRRPYDPQSVIDYVRRMLGNSPLAKGRIA